MNPLLGMKHRALFSSKDNAKKIKFSLLQDSFGAYRKNSKYWDIYVWANSVDSDQTKEQSDQDLHFLPFFLHLLEELLHCKIKLFY